MGKGEKMKRVFLFVGLLILLIAACSPQAQPTDLPPVVEEGATHISTDLSPAQRAAITALSQNLDLGVDQIKVVSTEAVDWPDGCLGVSREEISCTQVITPGFRVILDANGKRVEYRTNQDGSMILPATVVMTWSRVGGIAGFCDNLTIYLSGEIQGSSCNTSQIVEKSLSELLTAEQISSMDDWISKYGVVNIDASDPKGVADGMTVKLQLMGQGTEQMTSPQVQQTLLLFVQDLYQKLMTK
jgi:hypothetical protein